MGRSKVKILMQQERKQGKIPMQVERLLDTKPSLTIAMGKKVVNQTTMQEAKNPGKCVFKRNAYRIQNLHLP